MRISDWSSDVCSSDLITGWSVARSQVFILATTVASASAVLLRVDLQTGIASTVIDEKATTCRYEPNTLMYNVPNVRIVGDGAEAIRSEEHTSELQSLMRISYAVFCLKKKNKTKPP